MRHHIHLVVMLFQLSWTWFNARGQKYCWKNVHTSLTETVMGVIMLMMLEFAASQVLKWC